MLIAGLAVVAAIVAGVLVWVVVDDSSDDVATESTAPTSPVTEPPATAAPTTDPPSTDPPSTDPAPTDPPPSDPAGDVVAMEPTGHADFDAAIDDAARFVEDERGLLFKEPVRVEVLDDEAFVERLETTFEEEDRGELELTQDLFRAMGLIDAETDLVEALHSLLSIGVLGYYDPETGELVVRGSDPTMYIQQTIVHELNHALDDQWFELDRPDVDEADDESSFGFSALVEGNARRVEDAWEAQLTAEEQDDLLAEEMSFGADIDPTVILSIPPVLFELLEAPYSLGQPFVDELLANGGQEMVDATFEEPPVTSEQIMHPERFLSDEPVVAVDPPEADGEVIDEGAFGELLFQILLSDAIGSNDAEQAADGWGGDWYVAWDEGDRTCVRVDVATDTAVDGSELEQALTAWAGDSSVDASVESVGELVRLTTCG